MRCVEFGFGGWVGLCSDPLGCGLAVALWLVWFVFVGFGLVMFRRLSYVMLGSVGLSCLALSFGGQVEFCCVALGSAALCCGGYV